VRLPIPISVDIEDYAPEEISAVEEDELSAERD